MVSDRYMVLQNQVWAMLKESPYHINITHLDGVAILCAFIGLKRGLKVEICRCSGLLHDLWLYCRFPINGTKELKKQHGYNGSDLAKELLIENGGYSCEELKIICEAIYNHNDKELVHDGYSEALKDADAFWHYLNSSDYDKSYNYYGRDKKLLDEFMI